MGPRAKLSTLNKHTCAMGDDGRIWCWGENTFAELGDGTMQSSGFPIPVRLPGVAIDVSAGHSHTCALLETGVAYCWGYNDFNRTDAVSTIAVTEPTEVSVPGVRFTKISCGDHYTCAITDRSTVYCWGETTMGQCGIDGARIGVTHTGPVEIDGLNEVRTIESGLSHTCAVRTGSPSLVCWGSNSNGSNPNEGIPNGKLGPAASGATYSAIPVTIDLGTVVLDVGVGYQSTYAIGADGVTYAWGADDRQQLGTKETGQFVAQPSPVVMYDADMKPLLVGLVVDVMRAGPWSECAKLDELSQHARYVCWGSDDHGEVGFGVAKLAAQYGRAATALPQTASNMVRGHDHACITAHENAATEIWCYGLAALVADGTTDHVAEQVVPRPIKWNPENFEKVFFQ